MEYIFDHLSQHHTTLAELKEKIQAVGGDENTPITIEADGEQVYVYAHP